jgi:hypothetical protein
MILMKNLCEIQCCGSGSGQIKNYFPSESEIKNLNEHLTKCKVDCENSSTTVGLQ